VVGALVVIAVPEGLRFLALPAAVAANLRLLLYGAALVVMMHLRPQGLAGRYRLE
jgi:branched-chain amino acid transport system permease protein